MTEADHLFSLLVRLGVFVESEQEIAEMKPENDWMPPKAVPIRVFHHASILGGPRVRMTDDQAKALADAHARSKQRAADKHNEIDMEGGRHAE